MFAKLIRRSFSKIEPLGPLDGRYQSKIVPLTHFFSEKAFMKYRIVTEVEWLKFLLKKNIATSGTRASLSELSSINLLHF